MSTLKKKKDFYQQFSITHQGTRKEDQTKPKVSRGQKYRL